MDVQELLASARDSITVKRIYGEPVENGGVTIIPAAVVGGGGGGGSAENAGENGAGEGSGSGSGFGLGGRPVGAFVIRDGSVRWHPAVDVTRLAAHAITAATLLALLHGRRRR